jgi:RNA polymerase sigma factor (sigma-70 family)
VIRVVVADDHAIVRAGIRALLSYERDVEIVAEVGDGQEAVAAVSKHAPDVLLLDLSMPGGNGVEAIRQVHTRCPRTRVLVLSMHLSADYVRPALRAGAVGYVVKGSGLDHLVTALRVVVAGETWLDPSVQAVAEERLHAKTRNTRDARDARDERDELDRLTQRERQVLQLVAEGHTNRRIAERLGLSPKTVDTHRTSLMRKLALHDAQALTRFAVRRGLVSED